MLLHCPYHSAQIIVQTLSTTSITFKFGVLCNWQIICCLSDVCVDQADELSTSYQANRANSSPVKDTKLKPWKLYCCLTGILTWYRTVSLSGCLTLSFIFKLDKDTAAQNPLHPLAPQFISPALFHDRIPPVFGYTSTNISAPSAKFTSLFAFQHEVLIQYYLIRHNPYLRNAGRHQAYKRQKLMCTYSITVCYTCTI